ncbi:MAG: response regulator [Chthoniobacterales bacterium]
MKKSSELSPPCPPGTDFAQTTLFKESLLPPGNSSAATETPSDFRLRLNQKLRTPLNGILGFAELLEMEPLTETSADYARHIRESARELLEIINAELTESDPTSSPPEEKAVNTAPCTECDVLYIEDDPVNFTLVQRILNHRPALKLAQATRGEIGVNLARTQKPKLILLDLHLPDIHGAEVLRLLRADAASVNIPVVVVSADATPSQIERLLSGGARNYLTKPLSIRPFLAIVDEIVRSQSNLSTPSDLRHGESAI